MAENCINCVYYYPEKKNNLATDDECRRFPPTIIRSDEDARFPIVRNFFGAESGSKK